MKRHTELCANCARPAEGNYSVHRDGFGVGPEVPLCDWCGGSAASMRLDEMWAHWALAVNRKAERQAAERRERREREQEDSGLVRCSPDPGTVRCSGFNRNGEPCRNNTTNPAGLCRYHEGG